MCDWALDLENTLKMTALSAHILPIQRVPNVCSATITYGAEWLPDLFVLRANDALGIP